MKKKLFLLFLIPLVGCAGLADTPKNIIGLSTRDMEAARTHSVYRSFPCSVEACYAEILSLAARHGYHVFMKDETRKLIVLMNIPGYVDTTEVGVFLMFLEDGVRVELSSRSSPAKRAVAQILFPELAQRFSGS